MIFGKYHKSCLLFILITVLRLDITALMLRKLFYMHGERKQSDTNKLYL